MSSFHPSDFFNTEREYDQKFLPLKPSLGLNEDEEDYYQDCDYSHYNPPFNEEVFSDFNSGFPEPSNLREEKEEKEEKTEVKKEVNYIPKITDISSHNLNIVGFEETKKKDTKHLGRKKKGNHVKRKHDKNREDNKMRKIKSYIINSVPEYANESLSPQHRKFLKISKEVNENLNITYNRSLMRKSLAEIFAENPINGRYSKYNYSKYYNAELVDEIYRNNEEKNAIAKLNLTYKQYLDIFREKNIKKFENDILLKEIKNGEDESTAKKYTGELVNLLWGYEDWFDNKTARQKLKN